MRSAVDSLAAPGVVLWRGLPTLLGLFLYASRRFITDGCLTAAGALSYTTLVSLVPLIAIAFAVLSGFPIFAPIRDQILGELFGRFVPEVGAEMEYWFRYFAGAEAKTTALGVVALGVTVVLLLATIEDQLQNIWHVHSPRPWLQRILVYWAIMTLGPLLLGVAFSLPSYLGPVAARTGLHPAAILATSWAQRIVAVLPFLLETAVFTLIYALIPNCAVRWREALVGGVVAAVLIDALKLGFVLYISRLSSYRAVYGAMAAIPIFLLWMYIVWSAVLFGAVVAAALPRWRLDTTDTPAATALARLGLGFAVIAEKCEQMRHGGALTSAELVHRLGISTSAIEDDLDALQHAGLVALTASGGWVLARALDAVSLLDFYRALGIPLAQLLDSGDPYPWQARIAEPLHRVAALEAAALSRPLSEVLEPRRRSGAPRALP